MAVVAFSKDMRYYKNDRQFLKGTQKGAAERMKRRLFTMWLLVVVVWAFALSGCAADKPTTPYAEPKCVEQVGQIPEEFKSIVEKNTFYGVTAFEGRLLKAEICSRDKENRTVVQQVRMMDSYGNDLAAYTFSSDDAYHVSTLTATEDGGFLFVLGFEEYAYDQNTWASSNGYASRVIKCGKDGQLQFDTPFDGVEGAALRFCFEKDRRFYLFGTIQTPETKKQGVHSPTDIFMAILDEKGVVVKTQCIAGSDYDSLNAGEMTDSAFVLSIQAQSDDGDFAGSDSKGYPVDWVITVNDSLEITEKRKESGREFTDYKIGEKDGVPVYQSDALLNGFDAGSVIALIDYGHTYLLVSHNNTGVYENTPPAISSIWYYTETVYSLYEDSGKLIFRASVDSSPDYDAIVESYNIGNNSAS